jgi:uncharacterized protein
VSETGINLISGILIFGGIIGSILPILPGLPVSYAGLLLYLVAKAGPLTNPEIWALVVFGVLTLASMFLDIFAPAMATKGHKASKFGTGGAVIGALLGMIVLGPIGLILGPFIGAYFGELVSTRNSKHAFDIALAATVGLIINSIFKLAVGISMFIYFLVKVF